MNKTQIIHFLLFTFLCQYSLAQQYSDSTFNTQEKLRVKRFIKHNKKEGLCEFYDNDTLRFKIYGSFDQFSNWTENNIVEEEHYGNGQLKKKCFYLVIYGKGSTWEVPINRHNFYRKNGNLKSIKRYSNYGVEQYDSIFDKKGQFKKAIFYSTK